MGIWKKILLGFLIVNVPAILMMVGLPIAIINYPFSCGTLVGVLLAIVGFILSVYLSWWWWGVMVVKWKVYAYANIHEDDWKTLYDLSVKTYLSWPVGSVYNELERWSADQLQFKKAIIERIYEEIEFEKLKYGFQLPGYQKYDLRKRDVLISLLCLFLFLVCVVYLAVSFENLLVLLLFGVVVLISWSELRLYKVLLMRHGSIELTNESISVTSGNPFTYQWVELDEVKMISGKSGYELVLTQNEEAKIIDLSLYKIDDFDLFWRQVEVYSGRAHSGH